MFWRFIAAIPFHMTKFFQARMPGEDNLMRLHRKIYFRLIRTTMVAWRWSTFWLSVGT